MPPERKISREKGAGITRFQRYSRATERIPCFSNNGSSWNQDYTQTIRQLRKCCSTTFRNKYRDTFFRVSDEGWITPTEESAAGIYNGGLSIGGPIFPLPVHVVYQADARVFECRGNKLF